jgi:hypothetical protein
VSAAVWSQRGGVVVQSTPAVQVWLPAAAAVREARRLVLAGDVELSGRIAGALRRGWAAGRAVPR